MSHQCVRTHASGEQCDTVAEHGAQASGRQPVGSPSLRNTTRGQQLRASACVSRPGVPAGQILALLAVAGIVSITARIAQRTRQTVCKPLEAS